MTTYRVIAGIAALGWLVTAVACGRDREPCDSPGACSWPLVPAAGVSLRGPDLVPAHEIAAVALPPGARQGPDRWYRFDLELAFRLNLERFRDASVGVVPAYLSLAFDGDVAFQLKISRSPGQARACSDPAGPPALEWSTVGLVFGAQRGDVDCGGSARLAFANYLQAGSVHPGLIPVTLELQGASDEVLEELSIAPGARLFASDQGPPDVEIRPRIVIMKATDGGGTATLELAVLADERPVGEASVSVVALDASGHGERDFPTAGGPGVYTVDVAWEGPAARFLVSASTGSGSDVEFVEIGADERDWWPGHGAIPSPPVLVVGGGLSVALAVVAGRRGRSPFRAAAGHQREGEGRR